CVPLHWGTASAATSLFCLCFFIPTTASSGISTLSLHDALPISSLRKYSACATLMLLILPSPSLFYRPHSIRFHEDVKVESDRMRSEEHTSELQSLRQLVCRLLLEQKKNTEQAREAAENAHRVKK